MAVFIVITDAANEDLDRAISDLYPRGAESYRINDRAWLISADKLTATLSAELNLANSGRGLAVIFRVETSAAGWHQKSLWEWLSLKAASS